MLIALSFALTRTLQFFLSDYRLTIADKASQLIHQPVEIGAISATWRGLEPVVQLSNVDILSDDHVFRLVSANQLDVGINVLQSLLQKQLVLRSIMISGMNLSVRQTVNGEWIINGVSNFTTSTNLNNSAKLQEFISWLSAFRQVSLHDIAINWVDPNNKLWALSHVNIKFKSDGQDYKLKGQTYIQQNNHPALITIKLNAKGDINQLTEMQAKGDINTEQLNAGPILQLILTHFPHWQQMVVDMQPTGEVSNISVNYNGHQTQPADWKITAQLQHINWLRYQNIPGVQNLTGQLILTPELQNFYINSNDITLDFGKLFNAPIKLNYLYAENAITKNNNILNIQTDNFAVENADIHIVGQNTLTLPLQQVSSGTINLSAKFQINDGVFAKVKSYLPLTIIPPPVINWLENAIQNTGDSHGVGTLILRGPLLNFPYSDGTGQFLIDSQLKDFNLNYYPGWPAAQHMFGHFVFAGSALNANVATAHILNMPLQNITATIPDMSKDATLAIQGNVNADLADAQQFVMQSPLKKTVGAQLQAIQLHAPMQMKLNLSIPLDADSKKTTQVQGLVNFNRGNLLLPAWHLQLPNLAGQFQFTEQGFSADNIVGSLFNGPITLAIKTLKTDTMNSLTRINAKGVINLNQLSYYIPAKILNKMSGTTNYQAILDIPSANKRAKHLTITSQLQGVAINFTDPFNKTASQAVNFKLDTDFGSAAVRQMIINYGSNAVTLKYDASGKNIQQITAQMAQLNVYNQSLGNTNIVANRLPAAWGIAINNANVNGKLNIPDQYMTQGIQGQFSSIKLQSSPVKNNTTQLKPTDVPPINITSNIFSYGAINLQQVQLQLQPIKIGLLINNANASGPSYNAQSNGTWYLSQSKSGNTTHVQGKLQTNNVESTLTSWGIPAGLSGKNGLVTFNLYWDGAPYRFNLATLQGQMTLNLKQGIFSNIGSTSAAKMDFGKLLSVISLRTIARILKLDFSDITAKGFPYDTFSGDFTLISGVAMTRNTLIDGPIAQIALAGNIDLNNELYNLNIQVTPHMSSSLSVPLVATLAGGPVAGVVALAANRLISPEVQKMATSNYRVTGPWKNPSIVELNFNTNRIK